MRAMVSISREDLEQLEGMVDRYRLRGVVEALAHIAAEKADHLRTNWQDEAAASLWDKDAERLDRVASRLDD